jgi:transcriptional regulator GlxA family with amidase domain
MDIAIPIYDRFTALDAIGPYEVLSRLPDSRVTFIAKEAGPYTTDNGMLSIMAEARLDDLTHPEVVVVPGGTGSRPLMHDDVILDWIRTAHETSMYTTSVCTGSLLLGAAGLLDGLDATTHWLELETLDKLGARSTSKRVVEQGKVITAAGVSSGIDMALRLVQLMHGDEAAQAVQLGIEYDPEPPFDAGSPEKAPPAIVETVTAAFSALEAEFRATT